MQEVISVTEMSAVSNFFSDNKEAELKLMLLVSFTLTLVFLAQSLFIYLFYITIKCHYSRFCTELEKVVF